MKLHLASLVSLGMALMANAEEDDLLTTVGGIPECSTLFEVATAAGLGNFLNLAPKPLTFFAPSNDAFAKLSQQHLDFLSQPENSQALLSVFGHHAVSGQFMATDLMDGQELTTFNAILDPTGDSTLSVTVSSDGVFLDGAKVTQADVLNADGVIHVIDTFLIPNSVMLPELYICKICGESQTSTNPGGIIDLGDGATTCAAVYQVAQAGGFNETFCSEVVQPTVKDPCGCVDSTEPPTMTPGDSSEPPTMTPGDSSEPPTMAPVDSSEPPTMAPTDGATAAFSKLVVGSIMGLVAVGAFL